MLRAADNLGMKRNKDFWPLVRLGCTTMAGKKRVGVCCKRPHVYTFFSFRISPSVIQTLEQHVLSQVSDTSLERLIPHVLVPRQAVPKERHMPSRQTLPGLRSGDPPQRACMRLKPVVRIAAQVP